MLNTYLCSALKNRIAPTIAESGKPQADLNGTFISKLGKPFSDAERQRIQAEVGQGLGSEKTNAIIDKISNARHEWSIDAVEYGPALAICSAAQTVETTKRQVTRGQTWEGGARK